MRILVVEDEAPLGEALRQAFGQQGHAVDWARSGPDGLAAWRSAPYALVVLDLGLPGLDGLELCRQGRALGLATPLLALTARSATADKVATLDAGADDYLLKPFALDELLARSRALMRRQLVQGSACLAVGGLRLDLAAGQATWAGQPVGLSGKPRALLELLMREPGRLWSHEAILDRLWAGEAAPGPEGVRAHVKALRAALTAVGGPAAWVQTAHGVGYRLQPEPGA